MRDNQYNYLFVSDMHIAMGKNITRRAYDPREDFLYDQEFYNFLGWTNAHREPAETGKGKPWELVIVGDGFDFLPVEIAINDELTAAYYELANSLASNKEDGAKSRDCWGENIFFNEDIPLVLRERLLEEYLKRKLLKKTGYQPDPMKRADPPNPEMEVVGALPDWANAVIESMEYGEPQKDRKGGHCYTLQIDPNISKLRRKIEEWKFKIDIKLRGVFWEEIRSLMLTEEVAIRKMKVIVNGHPILFEGLANWISNGNKLVILAGNHDIEIRWPGVQRAFKDELWNLYKNKGKDWADKKPIEKDKFITLIDFKYSWFYFKEGLFYAEHGGQYDPLNSSSNFLEPYVPIFNNKKDQKDDKKRIYLPFGSLGVWLLVARLEDLFPQWEILGDYSGAILNLFKKYPFTMIRSAAENIGDLSKTAWRTFLSTTGNTVGSQLWRSFQMAIIGLLHWITYGLWHQINFLASRFRKADPSQESKYLPYMPYPTKNLDLFCRIALIKPETALKIYHSWYPFKDDFQKCADESGMDPKLVEKMYYTWDKPADLYRIPMFLFLFIFSILGYLLYMLNLIAKMLLWILNPLGGLGHLIVVLLVIQWLSRYGTPDVLTIIRPVVEYIKAFFANINLGSAQTIKFIAGVLLAILALGFTELIKRFAGWLGIKFFYFFIDGEEYILNGAQDIRKLLENEKGFPAEKLPKFYIMGHDHKPMVRLISADPFNDNNKTYFYNTGSWLPWFADQDLRRMRTGGLDNEFTFVKITVKEGQSEWETAEINDAYLRWNDFTGRPQEQFETAVKKGESHTRLLGGWPGIGLFAGVLTGLFLLAPNLGLINLAVSGFIGTSIGWMIEKMALYIKAKRDPWGSGFRYKP